MSGGRVRAELLIFHWFYKHVCVLVDISVALQCILMCRCYFIMFIAYFVLSLFLIGFYSIFRVTTEFRV